MKKISIILLVVLLLFGIVTVSADAPADNSVTGGCRTLDGNVPVLGTSQLVSNNAAAIVYEVNTDSLLYAYNADSHVQPSSLLKIMTALIAIEKANLSDMVTVRTDVLDTLPYDAAMVGLVADEVVSVKDLIYCMMVSSGNDAAVVLADYVMGSQEAFVAEMNRYAAELGCTATNFINVHGIHDDAQYTTARDVARILKKAIGNEQFQQVFAAKTYEMPATNQSESRTLNSQNYLINNDKVKIYFDERVTGGRTAVNNDRSRSIATTAQANGMDLICIVIGSKSQFEKDGYTERVFGGYNETKQLLDLAFNGYKTAQVLYAGQVLQQSSVLNGGCEVSMGIHAGVHTVVPENIDINQLTFRYANEVNLIAPIEKGQKLSTLQIWNGAVCIAETDVYAMNRVPVAGTEFDDEEQKSRINIGRIIWIILGAILSIAVAAVIAVLLLRRYRAMKLKKQSRRYRRNRRRSR